MASVRLTKDLKDDILKKLLKYKCGASVQALAEKRAVLAKKIFNDIIPKKDRKIIDDLPKGWLATRNDVSFRYAGSDQGSLNFNGRINFGDGLHAESETAPAAMNIPNHIRYNVMKVYEKDDPKIKLIEDYEDLKGEYKDLEEEIKTAKAAAKGALNSVTTVRALIKNWPEVEPFIPAHALSKQNPTAVSLPIKKLNETFELPMEEVE